MHATFGGLDSEKATSVTSKPKTTRKKRLKRNLIDGADEISFTGIKYVFGSTRGHYIVRLGWLAVFIAGIVLGISLFVPIWQAYYTGETVIVIDEVSQTELEYPAVTICNLNKWRRSVVGAAPEIYPRTHSDQTRPEDIPLPNCSAPKLHEVYPQLNKTEIDAFLYSSTAEVATKWGFFTYLITSPTSYQSVLQCRYKGRILSSRECYSSFINTVLFDGMCFIFNPSHQMRTDAVTDGGLREQSDTADDPSFPKQVAEEVKYVATARGPIDAVDLLMNVQQYEYCSSSDTGVGFEIQVTSRKPELRPMIMGLNADNVRLTPGRHIIASVQKVKYVRKTVSFGRCLETMKYRFYPNVTDYYYDACITDCVTQRIEDMCRCMPVFAPIGALNEVLWNTTLMNVPMASAMCLGPVRDACVESAVLSGIVKYCSTCKTPCNDINFVIHVTYNTFPAENAFDMYKKFKYPRIDYDTLANLTKHDGLFTSALNFSRYIDPWSMGEPPGDFKDMAELKQNLLLLRFQYYDMSIQTIVEKLSYSVSDVISQFGGLLGLFIGASIISFVELLYWILVCCKSVIKPTR